MADKFHRAARDGYLDLLRDANRREMNSTDEDGRTPAMVAAGCGNLEALRVIVMRGGNVNKVDLLGYSSLHHACRLGHMNCVTFLVNYGADFWILDNDMHSPLDVAALENFEDIVKFLDEAQTMQQRKNPKFVQQQKEKAMREAERNLKNYEKAQERASKEMARTRHRIEKQESVPNGDFKPPSSSSFVKKLTLRIKGNTAKSKARPIDGVAAFSDLVGTSRGTKKMSTSNGHDNQLSIYDFRVSDTDSSGNRTMKSVKGTIVGKNAQVLYTTNEDNVAATDSSVRPLLSNIFPGANMNKGNSDPHLVDSGVDSFESVNEEETPGIFYRPGFGEVSMFNSMKTLQSFQNIDRQSADEIEAGIVNGNGTEGDSDSDHRISNGSYLNGENDDGLAQDLPWTEEDVDPLDDDDDESEYTPVVVFLEVCGLSKYVYLFTSGDVDMDALMKLTNQDFEDMGLPIGPRRKLMDAIQRRRVVLSEPAQMYDSQL